MQYVNLQQKLRPSRRREKESLLILGETTWRDQFKPFGMLPKDRLRHLWILGKTGSGKSTLLANLLAQDLEAGTGVALLDPHGSLVEAVTPFIPRRRHHEMLLFSPADEDYPISFNVFRQGKNPHPKPALLCSELISVFKKQWAAFWGPRMEHVLRNAILAVQERPDATVLLLYRFLTDEALREKMVERVDDPLVREFWTKEFPSYSRSLQAEALSPVRNKLGAFVSSPIIRNIVGQVRNRVDIGAMMDRSGIILADLATGEIGEDASHLLGGLLLSSIQLAAMHRTPSAPPFIVYVDEFQNFVTDSLATMLAESRKFGVGLVLAHQYLSQLSIPLRNAVLGNVGSIVLFALGGEDAGVLEREFFPPFCGSDLQKLGKYQTAVKLLVDGTSLDPFSARTKPPRAQPKAGRDAAKRMRSISREKYSQSKKQIERAISAA